MLHRCAALAFVAIALLAATPAPKPAAAKTVPPVAAKTSSPSTSAPKAAGLQPAAPKPAKPLAPETLAHGRSEEHTSELQSHSDLVCRLLLEKKKQMVSMT